ncbi:MAG: hypothetical protein IJG42_03905 [Muribaculaceae bacterium]|nr:hypothetical protein [Muribaculaceae bacterium]
MMQSPPFRPLVPSVLSRTRRCHRRPSLAACPVSGGSAAVPKRPWFPVSWLCHYTEKKGTTRVLCRA